jgi:aspartyl-tRNA(Asn)/glutamyl-tRNA(Gln) amidotransferase subunit B
MKFEPVIGIETHVQLATKTKLFCACDNDSREAEPNTNVCPVCLAFPGSLPVLNGEAVGLALRIGLALNAEIPEHTKFDRKNYFYPDSPSGYQITQYDQPIIGKGHVEFPVDGKNVKVGVTRSHLEADAGKLVHPAGADYSLVDLNRAGTPLVEIVSEPDMRSAAEAKGYAQELYHLMRYAGVSDADLYYGNMRFDVNVSLRPVGGKEFGTRTETKNLNSFRAVFNAVEFEIKRQTALLEKGEKVVQETRGWNDDKQETFSQRNKEEAHDYRYFPEPDLPPLVITKPIRDEAKKMMPTIDLKSMREAISKTGLGDPRREQLVEFAAASTIASMPNLAELYLQTTQLLSNERENILTASFVIETLKPYLDERGVGSFFVTAHRLAKLVSIRREDRLNPSQAKDVLRYMVDEDKDPEKIMTEKGIEQVSDTTELEKIVDQVIAENPQPAADYKAGQQKALGFLVGQVMKLSKGQANPPMVNDILRKKLGS